MWTNAQVEKPWIGADDLLFFQFLLYIGFPFLGGGICTLLFWTPSIWFLLVSADLCIYIKLVNIKDTVVEQEFDEVHSGAGLRSNAILDVFC